MVVAVAMSKEVELETFGHERVLEERDLRFLEERERKLWVLEERGSLENVLEGLGEPVFDKEVLGWSFFWVCVHVIEYFGFVFLFKMRSDLNSCVF